MQTYLGLIVIAASFSQAQQQPSSGLNSSISDVVSVLSAKIVDGPNGFIYAEIVLQNRSKKAIYGYSIKGEIIDTNGQKSPLNTAADLVPLYHDAGSVADSQLPPGYKRPSIFRAGETYTVRLGVPSSVAGGQPTVAVTMVAFDDKSTIGSIEEVYRLQRLRSTEIEYLTETLADLKSVRDGADPKASAAALVSSLRAPHASESQANGAPRMMLPSPEGRITRLMNQVNATQGDKGRLAKSVAYHQDLIAMLKDQATLTEVGR